MFKVYLLDSITKERVKTICKTRQDLSNLILHLDAEKYEITEVKADNTICEDYKMYIKKDPNMEIGV